MRPDPHPYYHQAKFLTSCAQLLQLPPDQGAEVAFVGRSNAGKSSALNAITGQRQLARVAKLPGRTQLINLFTLDPIRRLADLPGYGYARVSDAMQRHWQNLIEGYLQRRHCLQGLVLVMDIRHALTAQDQQLLGWAAERGLPAHALLTKADKLSFGAAKNTLLQVTKELAGTSVTAQIFSATSYQGVAELHQQMDTWLGRFKR
ncbi:MAG: ribosome biogenesis GTP-binding protein YihA/YsxC [Pseudomonadota bacterium]